MRYIDRYAARGQKDGRFYQESGWQFIPSNPIAQSNRLDPYFGELTELDNDTFLELYVKPNSKTIGDAELQLLSDITKINVTAWRTFSRDRGLSVRSEALLQSKGAHGQPMLIQIVAPMGTGKSTYLAYFLRFVVSHAGGSQQKYVSATFDFRKDWVLGTPVEPAIYEFLRGQAPNIFPCFSNKDQTDFYKNGYQSLLKVFGERLRSHGVSDQVQTLESAKYQEQLQFISRHGAQPEHWARSLRDIYSYGFGQHKDRKFIFAVDNIDIFAEVSPSDAIAVLNQIGGMLKIDTMITLRDTTYRITQPHRSCASWHHPTTIILPAIENSQIAELRLRKVKTVLQKEPSEHNLFYRFIASIIAQIRRPLYYPVSFDLKIVRTWLDSLSNHNVRSMLDILLQVLKSHHLTSETFGRRFTSTFFFDPKHNINVKRFKTAFILGSAPYYSEGDSRTNVVNLFEAHGGTSKAWPYERHVFCLKLLQYLAKQKAFSIEQALADVDRLLGANYLDPAKDCVRRFWQKGLIVTEALAASDAGYSTRSAKDADFLDPRVQQGHSFVSPNGKFHLRTLIRDDIYLDEMKFSTDLSEEYMLAVFDNRNQESDAWARLRATGAFVRLIADCESKTALSRILGVEMLGPVITKAYNDRKAAERMGWRDM